METSTLPLFSEQPSKSEFHINDNRNLRYYSNGRQIAILKHDNHFILKSIRLTGFIREDLEILLQVSHPPKLTSTSSKKIDLTSEYVLKKIKEECKALPDGKISRLLSQYEIHLSNTPLPLDRNIVNDYLLSFVSKRAASLSNAVRQLWLTEIKNELKNTYLNCYNSQDIFGEINKLILVMNQAEKKSFTIANEKLKQEMKSKQQKGTALNNHLLNEAPIQKIAQASQEWILKFGENLKQKGVEIRKKAFTSPSSIPELELKFEEYFKELQQISK